MASRMNRCSLMFAMNRKSISGKTKNRRNVMKQVSHLRSLKLSLLLALAFVFGLPSIAAGQCESKDCADCDTVAKFASSLPRLSAAELKQAKFSAEEVDRY